MCTQTSLENDSSTRPPGGGSSWLATSSHCLRWIRLGGTSRCSSWRLDIVVCIPSRCCLLFTLVHLLHAGALRLGFTLTLVWVSNAVPRPPAKRSAAIGLVNGFGNLGNLYVVVSSSPHVCADRFHRMGSYIWQSNWGPEYHQSMIIALCALVFASALSFGV